MPRSRDPSKTRKGPRKPSHRHTLSLQKTQIVINVYDLLPPGRLATVLWTVGASLLHSGVVINDKEYAYGGHDRRGMTGVYWTRPKTEPPGGTFKCEILHGFTLAPQVEIDAIIKEASEVFQGTSYNLLNKNCNHFTAFLCEKLTGRSGPGWLNRAASIGVALPCVVPKEWIAPPDFETADGELVDDEEDDSAHEHSMMLGQREASRERRSLDERPRSVLSDDDVSDDGEAAPSSRGRQKGKGKAGPVRDTSGRVIHPAEIAPVP